MPKTKEGLLESKSAAAPMPAAVPGRPRAPIAVAVMGRAVLVELTHGFDMLVLVLESGPVAHLCRKGRVVARVPMAQC